MSPYYGPNRRREHRFKLSREVHYRLLSASSEDSSFRRAISADVSRRGLRAHLWEPLELGSRVEIFVLSSDGTPKVRGEVEVVRCTPQPLTNQYYNEYYNPDTLIEYEVGLKSAGSALFRRVTDLST